MSDVYRPPAVVGAAARTSIGAVFRSRAEAAAARTAVVDGARRLTYGELNARINRLANGLAAMGVGHGDRVAMLAQNRLEYVEVELAVAKLGAITAAQNWRLADRELSHCLNLITAKVVICQADYVAALDRLEIGSADGIVLGEDYERLIDAADETEPRIEIDPEDGVVILSTSGTTGLPKGAAISHRAVRARASVFAAALSFPSDDTFVA